MSDDTRRKLLRGRAYLVRLRTSLKNRIHGHLTAENCRTTVTDLYGRAGRAWLATVALSPMGRLQVDLLLELVDELGVRIQRLDDRVKRLVQDDPVAQRLQTWPGIGTFGAALLLAEIGPSTGSPPLTSWRPMPGSPSARRARATRPGTGPSAARGARG